MPILLAFLVAALGAEGYFLYDLHHRLKNGYTEVALIEEGQSQPANAAEQQGNGQAGTQQMTASADPLAEIWTIHHIMAETSPLYEAALIPQPDLLNSALETASAPAPMPTLENKGDNFVVTMSVPGLKKSDIQTQIRGDTLTISGNEKNVIEKKQGDKVVANERITRHFQSTFNLPEHVKADKMKVDYNHDMLTITLPKA
ncbi:MAG: Hsp20/alpha crystallin family protein [Thermodesulfobacteriota bacterium]